MYNRELRTSGIESTQFTLLMALDLIGETTQKTLGQLLAIDSTTLTRSLTFLIDSGWIAVNSGGDRRKKLLSLTAAGKGMYRRARVDWIRAQEKLKASLGESAWRQMDQLLAAITAAARQA